MVDSIGKLIDTKAKPDPRDEAPRDTQRQRPLSTYGEIALVCFVGGTLIVYVVLVCISLQTLHADQRPYLIAGQAPAFATPPGFVANAPLFVSIQINNVGKSPAMKQVPVVKLVYFPSQNGDQMQMVEGYKTFGNNIVDESN